MTVTKNWTSYWQPHSRRCKEPIMQNAISTTWTGTESTSITVTAAGASVAFIILYHVLMFALIFIRPDIDPSWHTISEYAIGPWGWVMSLAFITGGVSYALLFVAIAQE